MGRQAPGTRWSEAARDLRGGLSSLWLWPALGWADIRQRYSGAVLGSFWITANIALMALVLTFVFAGPLGVRAGGYAAYVTIGLVLWYFIQNALNEASNVFVVAAETIRNTPMPLSVQVLRLTWRNLIVLAHNAAIVPLVLVAAGIAPAATAWTAIPAVLLLVLAIFFAGMLLGLLGARFRDVPQMVSNLMQLLFFLTPVFWLPQTIGAARGWFVATNPIFAFIDIVRAPLLGGVPAAGSWPLALAVTAAAGIAAAFAFAACRARVAYWI
ncbi:MAG TPA: ABC transporter permease [Allosphingosinicella sp.]|jgi:ABC-type polysaccharide/polyol phosphate export permease